MKKFVVMINYGSYEGWKVWGQADTLAEAGEIAGKANHGEETVIFKQIKPLYVEDDQARDQPLGMKPIEKLGKFQMGCDEWRDKINECVVRLNALTTKGADTADAVGEKRSTADAVARLDLWARDHAVPALRNMVRDIKQLDGTCPRETFLEGEAALSRLTKEFEFHD